VVTASEDYPLQNRVICLTSPPEDYLLPNRVMCLTSGPLSGILRTPLCAHLPEKWCPLLGTTCCKIVVFVSGRVLCLEFCTRRCARSFRKGGGRFRGLPVTKLWYVSYVLSSVQNPARAVMVAPSVKLVAASKKITKLLCFSYVWSAVRNSARAVVRTRAFRKTAGRFRGLLVRKPTYLSYVGSSSGYLRAPLCALACFLQTISHYFPIHFYRDL